MSGSLYKRPVTLKTGQEQLTLENQGIGVSIGQFWQWSVSDLVSNATRGRFAEFIVATALDIDISNPRDEWAPFDLISPEGINIEVKSALFLQSWDQSELSKVKFSIKLSRQWEAVSNRYADDSTRPSDVYVFCLLSHMDKQTLNPLNLDQWEFYVMPTRDLNSLFGDLRSLSLSRLQKHCQAIQYQELRAAVKQCRK